jgi:predicted acyltransferase
MLEPGQNLAAWIDSRFLPGKMWQGTWDPEGILSTFPAVVTTISGMLAGAFLLGKMTWEQKVIRLMVAGFVLTIAGVVWGWAFPINKNLWTSSYVLFTSGLALLTLGASIFMVDMLGHKKWTMFGVIYGSNAITVYVLAGLLYPLFYDIKFFGASFNTHFFDLFSNTLGLAPKFVSMMYALFFVGVNFIPAYILYRQKIFIKL